MSLPLRRRSAALAALAALVFAAPARAESDPALGVLAGAATLAAGLTAGAVILSTSNGVASQDNAGWLTMQSGFVLAPVLSHGIVGEWKRGLAFSTAPIACEVATAELFYVTPVAVEHGTLPAQRAMWVLFGVGLFSGAAGVIDTAFAGERARAALRVVPTVGRSSVGLEIGGTL
jgi:hypothetical protein